MDYSRVFGSNFPSELIPVGSKKDIDDSVKILISQYYRYIDAGDILSANEFYNTYKESLEPYIIDCSYFNRLEEEIYNVGISALSNLTTIVSDTEPISQETNSHWLKEW